MRSTLTIHISKELKKEFDLLCRVNDFTMTEILTGFMVEYIEQHRDQLPQTKGVK